MSLVEGVPPPPQVHKSSGMGFLWLTWFKCTLCCANYCDWEDEHLGPAGVARVLARTIAREWGRVFLKENTAMVTRGLNGTKTNRFPLFLSSPDSAKSFPLLFLRPLG